MVEMPNSACSAYADCRNRECEIDGHCDPRDTPRPNSFPLLGMRPTARRVSHRDTRIVEIDADERIAAVVVFDADDIDAAFAELDARYLAGEAAAALSHVVGRHAESTPRLTGTNFLRLTPDCGQYRPPAGAAFAPGDLSHTSSAAWDLSHRHQHLHRGCAPAERPRSGRHPCRHRGLRTKASTPSGGRSIVMHGRRRSDQPLRDLRRGRPRRRARAVRRAKPAGTAAGERGKPSG